MLRSPSVVSREIANNGGRENYRAVIAQGRAAINRLRPKPRKIESDTRLHDVVNDGLGKEWSPQQISKNLVSEFGDDETMRVSHETIYETLFVQAKGELRTRLKVALRTGRAKRVPHGSRPARGSKILDMTMISDRPAEVTDRAVPGHWEGDLIMGKGNRSQILTLVERHTRYVILQRIPFDKTAKRVAYLLSAAIEDLPAHLKRSITWDQGTEMAAHKLFTIMSNVPVYFCDPHSPWQRGSNENTNGLLRQYFPKGTDLSDHTQEHLNHIADRLNGRPRQTLNWATPTQRLNELLHTT